MYIYRQYKEGRERHISLKKFLFKLQVRPCITSFCAIRLFCLFYLGASPKEATSASAPFETSAHNGRENRIEFPVGPYPYPIKWVIPIVFLFPLTNIQVSQVLFLYTFLSFSFSFFFGPSLLIFFLFMFLFYLSNERQRDHK